MFIKINSEITARILINQSFSKLINTVKEQHKYSTKTEEKVDLVKKQRVVSTETYFDDSRN